MHNRIIEKYNNGEYQLLQQLGEGSSSQIILARNLNDHSLCVLKAIDFNNSQRKQTFIREAKSSQILRKASHVIRMDSCYYNHHFGVLVMEHMHSDLLHFLQRQPTRKLAERSAKRIFHQIAIGVDQCHSQGIAHLDLKPDNILLRVCPTSNRVTQVKLADFGFSVDFSHSISDRPMANQRGEEESESEDDVSDGENSEEERSDKRVRYNFASDQLINGTIQYAPPELLFDRSEGAVYADKVDIWSLGITLFAMITGAFPYALVDGEMIANDFELIKLNTEDMRCYDLIVNMLHFDPVCRLDIEQVLVHPWLNGKGFVAM